MPVLVFNAMDNAFRMAIPIQVYVYNNKGVDSSKENITAISFDAQIRLYLIYGNVSGKNVANGTTTKTLEGESFGFDFRLCFGSMVEEVPLQQFVKLS